MTNLIIRIIEVIIITIWAVIGLIFWLPFLVRMIALFIGAVIISAGGEATMHAAEFSLDKAARFYTDGFKAIHQSISSIINRNINRHISSDPINEFWRPLAIHMASVILFWGITVGSLIKVFV